MKIKCFQAVLLGLVAILFMTSMFTFVPRSHAQSSQTWSDPINLSKSGASTNPTMVVDSTGMIHVFWLDEFEGYEYANSSDGVTWTQPKSVPVPFSIDVDALDKPVMLAGTDGTVHILWKDRKGVLQYRQGSSSSLGTPSSWKAGLALAAFVVKFDAFVDSQGGLHVVYINNIDSVTDPAGVHYRRLDGSGWSATQVIYPSKYYRSLAIDDDANVQVTATTINDLVTVYISWDDRALRRIFLEKSSDGGKNWGEAFMVRGPEGFTGAEMPYNIDVGVVGRQILLLWQAGTPGGRCVQYSQSSGQGSEEFSQPIKISDDFAQCPQSSLSVELKNNVAVVALQMPDDLTLIAWDGAAWSEMQTQDAVSTFINPATSNSVLLGCQDITYQNEKLYLVGCDQGGGGDIWYSSRSLGSMEDFFPLPSAWTSPSVVASFDEDASPLASVADSKNNLHAFWVQSPSSNDGISKITIQYSRWNAGSWSEPATVFSSLSEEPLHLTTNIDGLGRLILAWVDGKTGELLFSWASSEAANRASEWKAPQYIPSIAQANSSPDILTDSSGNVLLAYAAPINERRGIYFVESSDAGTTWSKSYPIFDAASAGWDMVDQPKICLTGDGRLHALFSRYSVLADRRQSLGLYYSQSTDGGATWSEPEAVSEHPVQWSDIDCSGQQTVHRLWQEENESYFINLDQISQDGGLTWASPIYITSLSEKSTQGALISMSNGQLYFVHIVENENPTMQEWEWNGTAWNLFTSKELLLGGKFIVSSLTAGITSQGALSALIATQNQDPTGEVKNEIISLSRFLELSDSVPSMPQSILPTPVALATASDAVNISVTPTVLASLNDLGDSTPSQLIKNILGVVFVGGVLILVAIILRPARRKERERKKRSNE